MAVSLLKAQVQTMLMQRKDEKCNRRWFNSGITRKQRKGNKEIGTISAFLKDQYKRMAEAYKDKNLKGQRYQGQQENDL